VSRRSDLVGRISRRSSIILSAVRGKDTGPELLLRRAVHRLGLRYRLHSKSIFGRPDLVFTSSKVVVFCDGDFWHGNDWTRRRGQIKIRKKFWIKKIESNMRRDRLVSKTLREQGWKVLRFWESDIRKRADKIAITIERQVLRRGCR